MHSIYWELDSGDSISRRLLVRKICLLGQFWMDSILQVKGKFLHILVAI